MRRGDNPLVITLSSIARSGARAELADQLQVVLHQGQALQVQVDLGGEDVCLALYR
jgi:hypothetical protein